MIPTNLTHREDYLRRKRKQKIIKYSIIFFLILLIIGIASYISHRPELRISKVVLQGGVLVTEKDIVSKSLEFMQGSYIFLFPKNNTVWYPRKKLENYLKNEFKRIDKIDVSLDGSNTIVVKITERKPFALWCGDASELEMSKNSSATDREGGSIEASTPRCYFMDLNSTIFAEAPTFSGDAYFKYHGLVLSDSPIGLEYIASTTKFYEISNFVSAVKELSVHPLYLVAKDEDDFSIILNGGGEIYFDTKIPLNLLAQNLKALLATKELGLTKEGILPVEYIDLRFGNKLFYKLRK